MYRYLLDTSIVSMLAPDRKERLTPAGEWLRSNAEFMCIPTISLTEIRQGILKLKRLGSAERALQLEQWLERICSAAYERLLPLDADIALEAGRLSDAAMAKGQHPGTPDIIIAATAKSRDLELLTRNGRHFEPLGIKWHDPFDAPSI